MAVSNSMKKTLVGSTLVILLTCIHHLYGAVVYATPWRLHIIVIALPVVLALASTYVLERHLGSRQIGVALWWFYAILTAVFPVALIGFYEGGYNHVVKNILYFAGTPVAVLDRLYIPGMYELPNDAVFEITGVLQFGVGVYTVYHLARMLRSPATSQPTARPDRLPNPTGLSEQGRKIA